MAEMQEAHRRQRTAPYLFVEKTYKLVDDENNKDLICWSEDGAGMMIKDPIKFAHDLLPEHFTHSNFASFVRQLYFYGFKKSPDIWEFRHDKFKKGDEHGLIQIQRKKDTRKRAAGSTQATEAAKSSSAGEGQRIITPQRDVALNAAWEEEMLMREHKRLKIENAALKEELHKYRSICRHIAALLKDLAGADSVNVESSSTGGCLGWKLKIEVSRPCAGEPMEAPGRDINP